MLSVSQVVNAARAGASMMLRRPRCWGMPLAYIIEPTNYCDQRCAMCSAGGGGFKNRERGFMPWDSYCNLLDEIGRTALLISLYWTGEGPLHRQWYDMVKYAKQQAPRADVFSAVNGNQLDVDKVIDSGLDRIEFTLSGMTQATHEQYRAGGDLETVMQRIAELVKRGGNKPKICVKFLIMRHNEHELEEFLTWARNSGVHQARVTRPSLKTAEQGERYLPADPMWWNYDRSELAQGRLRALGAPKSGQTCEMMYSLMAIQWDGWATACCRFHDNEHPMGNVFEDGVSTVWNSHAAQDLRRLINSPARDSMQACTEWCHEFRTFTNRWHKRVHTDVVAETK